ncbi:hypothetical protein HDU81_000253 [Chytriomyces hyalinus]|nr:hypothetical protein HDU81_000253 [Chytriomyces hyalinus]
MDNDERPLLLISVVIKVMARLYYGSAGNRTNMDSSVDESNQIASSIDSITTNTTTTHNTTTSTSSSMNPRIYQELFDLRLLVVTLILKSPGRNSRALTVVIMQALLLVNRFVTHNESHSVQGGRLPSSLKSPRDLFLACLTLSEACLMDSQTSTRTWSKVSSLPPSEIAKLKNGALTHLEFKVHVNGEEFGWWCKVVMDWMQLVSQQQLF